MVKKALFLALFTLCLLLVPRTGFSVQKHYTTSPSSPVEKTRSEPRPHHLSSLMLFRTWIYTKHDLNSEPQVFLQRLESEEPETFPEYQVTNSGPGHEHIVNRRNVKFGPFDITILFAFSEEFISDVLGTPPLPLPGGATLPLYPLRYKARATETEWQECYNPFTFLYIGTSTITKKDNLYLGCADAATMEVKYFDVPLTNIDASRSFENIVDYDLGDNLLSLFFPSMITLTSPVDFNLDGSLGVDFDGDGNIDFDEPDAGDTLIHHQIAVATSDVKIHYMTMSPFFLIGDQINPDFIQYNEETHDGINNWPLNGEPLPLSYEKINEIEFADIWEDSAAIVYIAETSGQKTDIGMMNNTATDHKTLTDISQHRFAGLTTNKNILFPFPILLFEGWDVNDDQAQILSFFAGSAFSAPGIPGAIQWQDEIVALTPKDGHNRIHPMLSLGYINYARRQDDGYHDIYGYDFSILSDSSSSSPLAPGVPVETGLNILSGLFAEWFVNLLIGVPSATLPITTMTEFSDPFSITLTIPPDTVEALYTFSETRLTCSGDNTHPNLFGTQYLTDYTLAPEPPPGEAAGPSDLFLLEKHTASQETRPVHLYALAEDVECQDTCTEDADRSPILDEDEDGLHDERSDPLTGEKCDPSICGNGVTEDGETCDDGNFIDRDGCNATCKVEPLPLVEPEAVPPVLPVLQEDPPLVGGFLFRGSSCGCNFSTDAKPDPFVLGLMSIFTFFFVTLLFFLRKKASK